MPGYFSSNGFTSSWNTATSVLDAKSNRPSFWPAAHTCSVLAAPPDEPAAWEGEPVTAGAAGVSAAVDFPELPHPATSSAAAVVAMSARVVDRVAMADLSL
jgi:hypothetical protein